MNYAKDKVNDVVQVIAPRLLNIGKFESAAEVYEAVSLYDKAIEAFLEVKKWDRAMECAHQVRPMEMQQLYVQKINERKKQSYIANNKINKIIEGGDLSGLELLAQEDRWEECLQIAEKQGSQILNKFLAQFSRQYISRGQFKETARVLSRYNSPAFAEMIPVYRTIAQDVLATVNEVELQILREMLQKFMKNLLEFVGTKDNANYQEFMKYLMMTHLLLLKEEAQRHKLTNCQAKLTTSLLRYVKEIRADKAFLDAGDANRTIGNNDMAFIFFNRYIDLWDAIQDPEGAMIQENAEFEGTDIPPPYEIPIPDKNLLSEPERDKIRDWVLEINMDGNVGQQLPTRTCEFCNFNGLYEASLFCPQCNSQWEPCIITGYPLVRSQAMTCKFCNMGALRDSWNDFIACTQHCPWCNSMQTQV